MDDSFDIDDFVPGLFHLDLNCNSRKCQEPQVKKQVGRKISGNSYNREDCVRKSLLRDLTLRYESLRSDLHDNDVPDPESALVFLGVLASHLGKYREATQHFEDALEHNQMNLNAIAGLVFVCSKSPSTQQRAADCKKKIADLLGRSGVEATEDELNHRLSCCMADQAYAHAYDVGITSYEDKRERLLTATDLYDRALAVGSSVITMEEMRRWYLSMATIFVNQDTMMSKANESQSTRLPGYNRAVNLLKEIIKPANTYQTALAWAYLGILLERQGSFETTPMSIHDCGFTACEPVDCYSKAIEKADKDTIVLNRLAKVFQSTGKYELALGAADMSIRLEPNAQDNGAAYHVRARIRMELYVRDLSKCKCGRGSIPDRELLELAKDDLELILKVVDNDLPTYIEIGQVCYFMGVDAFKESFIVDEEGVNSALVYFSKALQCDMGDVIPQLQLLRGKCLKIKGEERNALECFKKAIELDKEGSANAQAFRCLMETLLTWFSHGELEKHEVLLTDIDGWIRLAQEKYSEDAVAQELRTLTHMYTHELLDLCKASARSRKLTLTRLCINLFSPQNHSRCSKSPFDDVHR